MPIEEVTEFRFNVSAHASISFTLVDPLGQSIDPDVATVDPQITYLTEPGDNTNPYWLYQYQVQNPANGVWQVRIAASDATGFMVYTEIDSPLYLLAFPSAGSYRPGETVLLHAALMNDDIIQTGATITGTLFFPDDTSLPLTFYDDGTHGDTTANNRIFTAQLTAPAMNGRPRFVVRATKGDIVRLTDDIFTIAAQTATFQQVVRETLPPPALSLGCSTVRTWG